MLSNNEIYGIEKEKENTPLKIYKAKIESTTDFLN